MDRLMGLVGLANDEKKSEDDCTNMVALGHFVNVSFAKRKVETRLDKEKAIRWMVDLEEIKSSENASQPWRGNLLVVSRGQ